MRSVVVCHEQFKEAMPENRSLQTVMFDGTPVTCGLIQTPDPVFDVGAPQNSQKVLVRVTAFSCNYRDKLFILLAHDKCQQRPNAYYAVGSEFAGVVVAVGTAVARFQIGDRVMGNNSYAGPGIDAEGDDGRGVLKFGVRFAGGGKAGSRQTFADFTGFLPVARPKPTFIKKVRAENRDPCSFIISSSAPIRVSSASCSPSTGSRFRSSKSTNGGGGLSFSRSTRRVTSRCWSTNSSPCRAPA